VYLLIDCIEQVIGIHQLRWSNLAQQFIQTHLIIDNRIDADCSTVTIGYRMDVEDHTWQPCWID